MGFLDFLFPKYCVACRKVGDYICPNCFSFISFDFEMICLVCNKGSIDGLTHPGCKTRYAIDGAFCAVAYKGIVKKLIYNFKYKPYLSELKKCLNELLYESLIQQEIFQQALKSSPILVPIPLYAKRLRKRGYNHSKLLAEGLSKSLNLVLANILQRTKETKSQFGLNLKDRKENLKNAFELRQPRVSDDAQLQNFRNQSLNSASLSKIRHQSKTQPNFSSSESGLPRSINHDLSIFLVDDILTSGSTLLEAAKILKKGGAKKVYGLTLARD